MHFRALGIHIHYSIVGTVIDDTRARPPLAAPHTPVAGAGPRLRFAQRALVELLVEAIGIAGAAIGAARLDRDAIRREIVEPLSEARIDIALQHIGAGVDMRVGIVDTEPVPHERPPVPIYL